MVFETLTDLLTRFGQLGNREAVGFSNGYRSWRYTYAQLQVQIAACAQLLRQKGLKPGDRLLLWGENRPSWLVVFWGCIANGIQVVPVDFRFSPTLAGRIARESQARLLVHGRQVKVSELAIPKLPLDQLDNLPAGPPLECLPAKPNDVVQIVYTSGTTGQPRGVVHRHRHLCANLSPVAQEIQRHLWLARPFQPIRILTLLPMSHVFGQAMGLFVPLLLEGAAFFFNRVHPGAIVSTVKRHRISVLVGVPRMLQQLQHHLAVTYQLPSDLPILGRGYWGAAGRWWRYRALHRACGWKFWCFITGGAPLDRSAEDFWAALGFVVIQGYGLTETSPAVAINHPFAARRGSIGKPVPGQTVRLAADGELLVKGESVTGERLGGTPNMDLEDGWLRTGDLAEQDAAGNLFFRGRKKDTIVLGSGLNVFPQDVEAVLNSLPGFVESAMVANRGQGGDQVHAVLILEPGVEGEAQIRLANQQLESHQRIRSWSLWPGSQLPRTSSTLKLKRAEIARWVNRGADAADHRLPTSAIGQLDRIVNKLSGRSQTKLSSDLHLDQDLGLGSLDRVELLSVLEEHYAIALDEGHFSRVGTVGDLRQAIDNVRDRSSWRRRQAVELVMPRWAHGNWICWLRKWVQRLLILPLFRHWITVEVRGWERVEGIPGPVIFAANHNSHIDTLALLAALPLNWHDRLAPAMSREYFLAHFQPQGVPWKVRFKTSLLYWLACGFFGAYPLPQRMGGIRLTLEYTGDLVERGFCPLIYPEGVRSEDGRLQPLKPGVELMAARMGIPIVPVWIQGTFDILSVHDSRPTVAPVKVRFGEPIPPQEGAGESSPTLQALTLAFQDLPAEKQPP